MRLGRGTGRLRRLVSAMAEHEFLLVDLEESEGSEALQQGGPCWVLDAGLKCDEVLSPCLVEIAVEVSGGGFGGLGSEDGCATREGVVGIGIR